MYLMAPNDPPLTSGHRSERIIITTMNTSYQENPIPPIERKNKLLYILGSLTFFLIIVTLLIVFIATRYMPQKQIKTIVPAKQTTYGIPTQVPLRKADITFEVLNGSGIRGNATKEAKILAGKGYTILEIGNADKTYQSSQLYLAPVAIDYQNELLNEIRLDFPTATFSGELTGSTASARLIIGKQ